MKAGYCDQCGQNVYVNDSGKCANGHSAGHVSQVYEVWPTVARKGPNVVLIAVLALVGLGLCVACGAFSRITGGDEASPSTPTSSNAASEEEEDAPQPLSLDVTAPDETEAAEATIKGTTLPGAKVTVAGKAVEVDDAGAFGSPVALSIGANTFDVVASLEGYVEAKQSVAIVRKSYGALTPREFELLVKDPDAHKGETYIIYGEVTQFDAATGTDKFRADTGAVRSKIKYGFTDYKQNSWMTGDSEMLADVVGGDCFVAKVTLGGSYSYDTQIGGSTTVPLFEVDVIEVYATTLDQ